ncbi:hypothetical protein [Bacteroidetes bacterium endosymbiont of Geopemphigus sp.]|nr:hypothetical protein [Bacteroidetes bacterium endosymbiont of Geopemphigus sp.]
MPQQSLEVILSPEMDRLLSLSTLLTYGLADSEEKPEKFLYDKN